jgi:hypothetical protein
MGRDACRPIKLYTVRDKIWDHFLNSFRGFALLVSTLSSRRQLGWSSIRKKDKESARELASLHHENGGLIHKIVALQVESGLSSGSIDKFTRLK